MTGAGAPGQGPDGDQDAAARSDDGRGHRRSRIAFTLGALLAAAALFRLAQLPAENFEAAAAAGADTRDFYATVDGTAVHCRDVRDVERCIDGLVERGSNPAVLWLGNSQLHSINQLVDGEVGAASLLQATLADAGRDLVVFSQPNANLQEHHVLFEALAGAYVETPGRAAAETPADVEPADDGPGDDGSADDGMTDDGVADDGGPSAATSRPPIDTLLLPLVFDDLRESGLRDGIAAFLSEPATAKALDGSPIGRTLLERHAPTDTASEDGPSGRWQRESEAWLESRLSAASDLWGRRGEFRSRFLFGLYALRNRALGISASTTRRLIPARYADNLAAYEALLASAERHGVEALVYVAPIRDDVPLPYDLAEYARFIDEARAIAEERGARFVDLGPLVDPEHWGLTGLRGLDGETSTEIDFMHFRASGHRVLADALAERLARP